MDATGKSLAFLPANDKGAKHMRERIIASLLALGVAASAFHALPTLA